MSLDGNIKPESQMAEKKKATDREVIETEEDSGKNN